MKLAKFICLLALAMVAAGCSFSPWKSPQAPKPPVVVNPAPPLSGKPPQFVVLAFDGSRSLPMWQETLDFSKQMTEQGHPLHFTYFISGVYFLNFRKASIYTPPKNPPGTSPIGFAESNTDIEKRVALVNRALAEGHEIGSHLNGHFNGAKWTKADWETEFSQFYNLAFSIDKNNDVSQADASRYKINLSPQDLLGFRAPDLGRNDALYQVLKQYNYAYDTSGVGKAEEWPIKLKIGSAEPLGSHGAGIWEFPLAQINYATTTGKILSMDYNFFFKQSVAKETAVKGTPLWNAFFNKTYTSYINYFNSNYQGSRAPVFIGSHFSLWNDGVYWEALKKTASEVCQKPEVRCVTFRELMSYLDQHPTDKK